jgi:RNA 3'-terminal phosphate cyclase (ATP)
MSPVITIDGSQGEGGGQIVRSSLALSMVTGQPIQIDNIRAGRKKPGLKRQHLTALQAAVAISNAEVEGVEPGTSQFSFTPQAVQPGEYYFSVGTAGSATLVLQTILPALMLADAPSTVTIEGGTHNQWAPPYDFLERAYLPLLKRVGPEVELTLHRRGFFPAGGGKFTAYIKPCGKLKQLDLLQRGTLKKKTVEALVAKLPPKIGNREVQTILRHLRWPESQGRVREVDSIGPGNIVQIFLEFANVCEVISACGRQGTPAEAVAKEAVVEAREFLDSSAVVGQHLADQLLLILGLSAAQGNGGAFRTLPLTQHSLTHIDVLKTFLDLDITIEKIKESNEVIVRLSKSL